MKLQIFLLLLCLGLSDLVSGQLKKATVNGAEFHYVDKGKGEPVVFIHGALEDYRTWDAQIDSFSSRYRVIAYSRRFNWPNRNSNQLPGFSAKTEAEDLASLIQQLNLGSVHLVGHSFGGLTALFLARQHPKLVRSLTLSEPALISWLPGIAGGQVHYDNFHSQLRQPVRKAFDNKDDMAVLRHTLIYFAGEDVLDQLPPEARDQLMVNIAEWRAIAYSPDPFPDFKKEYFNGIRAPTLILSGGKTLPIMQLINKELKTTLPNAQHFHLEEGTHDYWMSHPVPMGKAILEFLQTVQK